MATHLLLDALRGSVKAALVISNDSDLALPVANVRDLIPVGVINPTTGQTAGALKLAPGYFFPDRHWGPGRQLDSYAKTIPMPSTKWAWLMTLAV
ncbi:MAG: hypothetical protein LBJ02_12760 [Bifidobacteriaceae bacterium]|nr:hypothetical protein [Bifidobacteriaceae bacterium]